MCSKESKGSWSVLPLLMVVSFGPGCRRSVDPPHDEPAAPQQTASAVPATSDATATPSSSTSSQVQSASPSSQPGGSSSVTQPASGDPFNGKFSLQDATKGLAPTGKLVAEITTDAGKLRCDLFDDKAPVAVANFVGLARGLRPFKDPKTSQWITRPGYDGTGFHRIIKGFMIQGGDPTGTGAGEPGYVFQDEVWPGAAHDRRGLLCMANRGPNTNGMQFFILDGAARHLDRSFTIFGSCGPDAVIEKLANSEVRGDKAVNPPKIKKVTIRRGK
jgi:peptidyl-prolyl cis-trans isomerase A (cyclophilin A)